MASCACLGGNGLDGGITSFVFADAEGNGSFHRSQHIELMTFAHSV